MSESGRQWLRIGLFLLFVVLIAAVVIVVSVVLHLGTFGVYVVFSVGAVVLWFGSRSFVEKL